MMKFVLQKVLNGCRLGCMTVGEVETVTPLCMLYTRSGSVPSLTRDMLDRLQDAPNMVHFPLPNLGETHEAVADFAKGITGFTSLNGFHAYTSVQDPAVETQSGYNDKNSTAIWGRGGKLKVDVDLFMQIQESFQPAFYQALCDADTDQNSSKKRTRKSFERTLNFLDKIIDRHAASERLKDVGIIGAVVGGYTVEDRIKSAQETSKRPVAGFSIEGFHHYGAGTENIKMADIIDILQKTLVELPEDKPRMMHHVWSPSSVLEAVAAGIDIFDSSYPYIVTERGAALVFEYDIHRKTSENDELDKVDHDKVCHDNDANSNVTSDDQSHARPYEINLKEERFISDFGPLLRDCSCYTCANHSRAYINHLLNTSELLAATLLSMHNLHHYFKFFSAVRESIQTDTMDRLKSIIHQNRV